MARDPGSKWAPLPEAGAPDGFTKTQFIVHSTGDNASADRIRNYFANNGVFVESTFIVGVTSDDPTLQIMDSTDRADANGTANQRAISVEVVGDGTGPYTEWQKRELIRLGKWAAANHPIEKRIIPSESASGFGWHIMFGAPGPWTGYAKVCPGYVRISQLKSTIFPAIFAGTDPEDDDMTPEQDKRLKHVEAIVGDMAVREKADDAAVAKRDAALAAAVASAKASADAAAKAADAAADAALGLGDIKPVDLDALAGKIAALLNTD